MKLIRIFGTMMLAGVLAVPAIAAEPNRPHMNARMTTVTTADARLSKDLKRLEAILLDTQRDTTITIPAWRVIANESMTLANRVAARTRSLAARTNMENETAAVDAATTLRNEVKDMRERVSDSQTQTNRNQAVEPSQTEMIRQAAQQAYQAALRIDAWTTG
ncbi:MAG: hypothetical protein WBX15_06560 [Thermoanaerobaculia bacterium]